MSKDFEKKACKAVEEGLISKVFVKLPENSYAHNIFKSFGETIMTSLLVCNFMKTFDNADTADFMKKIKDFCDFNKLRCGCDRCESNGGRRNLTGNLS